MKVEDKFFFSIVTVVLNDFAGLQRTAASLKEQSFQNFEWIVMDGGSDDGTVEFMQRSENAKALFTTGPDLGIYDAMNKGTERASGKYVNYLNAGDAYCSSQSLGIIWQKAETHGLPEVIYAGTNYEFADGSLRYRPPREVARTINYGMPAIHQSTFYLRSFLEEPPYDLRYQISADYYLAGRCFLRGGRTAYVDKPVTVFPIGGVSTRSRARILADSWNIQRDVLRVPLVSRIASVVRRWLAHTVLDSLQALRRKQQVMR